MNVKVKLLYPGAKLPTYAKPGDAALDLYAATKRWDSGPKGLQVDYGTGIAIEIPEGYVGLLMARAGSTRTGMRLATGVGVIGSGEIRAVFDCTGDPAYEVGDRVAQLLILPYPRIILEPVDQLSETVRGATGFGSSGRTQVIL